MTPRGETDSDVELFRITEQQGKEIVELRTELRESRKSQGRRIGNLEKAIAAVVAFLLAGFFAYLMKRFEHEPSTLNSGGYRGSRTPSNAGSTQ